MVTIDRRLGQWIEIVQGNEIIAKIFVCPQNRRRARLLVEKQEDIWVRFTGDVDPTISLH